MRKTRIYARQHNYGMAIFLNVDGEELFVTTHRKNCHLFYWLADEGRTIDELRRWKPKRDKAEQALRRSLDHIIKLSDYVLKYEYYEAA